MSTPGTLSHLDLLLKFLRFGFLAWGGPIAQIAMMHEELVAREKWVSEEQFKKVLALYQALPGPEATELAVYFGYHRLGKLGGLLSGLGFVLPGFFLVLLISYIYVEYGIATLAPAQAFLYGIKPAVMGLIALAVYKIGSRTITNKKLLLTAIVSAAAYLLVSVNLVLMLFAAGLFYFIISKIEPKRLAPLIAVLGAEPGKLADIFIFFLKAGLLTFGGAYTVIPFLQEGAIGQWLTEQQFLEGLALAAMVPGPLIIVSTFIGYMAGGVAGAAVATFAIFLPAFAFTLLAFETIQKIIHYPRLQIFLEGLAAGVVAVIAMSSLALAQAAIFDILTISIFAISLSALWKFKANIAIVVIGGGLAGLLAKLVFGL